MKHLFSRLLFAVLILALMVALVPAQAKTEKKEKAGAHPAEEKAKIALPFTVGERLSYEVSWSNFLVAGELTLEVADRKNFDGIDSYQMNATAQSVGMVSLLGYKVKDVYQSFVDAKTLKPFRAEKRTRHKDRREASSVLIDHEQGTARIDGKKTIEIPPDTYDLASLIYAIRAMALTPGKAQVLTLLEDGKLYGLKVECEKREKIETRLGKYEALKITTKKLAGSKEEDPYKLRIYLTDDDRRLPVLISAAPSWGEVRVELTQATGTKTK